MIEFRCTHCDGVVRTPETHAGKKGRCPTCHEVVPIPEKSERLEPVEFPCEKCGHGMKAPGKFVGRQGKCAKCGHLMTIPPESVPHSEPAPVAKPVAAKPVTPAPAKAAPSAAASQPAKPAQPAAASPFLQAQPAAPKPNPFAQPQPHQPAAPPTPSPFAQPQPAARPHPAAPTTFGAPVAQPAADPFAGLGNFGSPGMGMPLAPAMPAPSPYAAPGPYAAPSAYGPAARPSTNSGDPAGVTSMILGIVSLVFVLFGGCCCTPFCVISFITAGGGLIVGFFGNSGFRVAGIVMSGIALFLNVVMVGALIAFWIISAAAEKSGAQYEGPPWSAPFEPDFGSDFETEFGSDF